MKRGQSSDKQLITLLLEKDQSAWREWYHSVSPSLMALCIRYVKDRDLAGDVLQNGFIKMFHSISSFEYRGEGSLRAWATRIVIHEALRELKASAEHLRIKSEDDLVHIEETQLEVQDLSQDEILELIVQLPQGYRTVFNLYVFDNKTHKEIAKELNISEGTSASQFHRAKHLLAEKIKLRKMTL